MGISTIDLTGKVINGLRVIQRASLSASANLKWETECVRCGSKKHWEHSRLIHAMNGAAGNVARCELSTCNLGTFVKGDAITERPKHEPEAVVTSPVAVPAPAKPVPVPKPDPLRKNFERASAAYQQWGNPPITFESFRLLKELKPAFFAELMTNVQQFEAEQQRKADAVRLGAEIEQQFNDEFNRKWGIQIVGNNVRSR